MTPGFAEPAGTLSSDEERGGAESVGVALSKEEDSAHVIRDTARQVVNAVLHREDED